MLGHMGGGRMDAMGGDHTRHGRSPAARVSYAAAAAIGGAATAGRVRRGLTMAEYTPAYEAAYKNRGTWAWAHFWSAGGGGAFKSRNAQGHAMWLYSEHWQYRLPARAFDFPRPKNYTTFRAHDEKFWRDNKPL